MLIRPIHVTPTGELWAARMVVAGVVMLGTAAFFLVSGVYVQMLTETVSAWVLIPTLLAAAWGVRAGVIQIRGSATLRIDLVQRTLVVVRRSTRRTLRREYRLDDVTIWIGPVRDSLYPQLGVVLRMSRSGWAYIHGSFDRVKLEALAAEIAARWGVNIERSDQEISLPLRHRAADFF
ncbi:MAG TPA: hypothetical protein VFF69_14150 [Phycisphaerales bacterium]|nr:hypothetical protein [Phycisphaerales bacterium]